ncbi:hypothetical protein [Streptomyces sp. NPDC007117]|uniref:hypothetical protein n=1 Tax=Streptomyces sp. NPDC007117 TaxID=3154314 RepID=UPI003401DB19
MTDTDSSTPTSQHVWERIAAALREHYLTTDREEADADRNQPCRCGDWREGGQEQSDEDDWDAHLTDVVLAELRTLATEIEQTPGGTCPHCAAHTVDLVARVQERIGGDTCPLCAEYLEAKRRADSWQASGTPMRDVSSRTEPTYREKIAAALYEQQLRRPWATAYPHDSINYLSDARLFLGIRDTEMTELRHQAALSDAVTAQTKELLQRRTTTLRTRAEQAESVILQALTSPAKASGFARGFRLVHTDGRTLDGTVFPSGRCFVLDDPEYGFATVTASVEELLRGGYHGARIEWPDQFAAEARTQIADALAKADGWERGPAYDKAPSPSYQEYLRQADVALAALATPPAVPAAPEETR